MWQKCSPFPAGPCPTKPYVSVLAGASVHAANADGVVVFGEPLGSGTFVELHALDGVREGGGGERLARLLAHMPDKQAAMLNATRAATG